MLVDFFLGQPTVYGIDKHANLDGFCDKIVHAFLDKHFFDIANDIRSKRDNGHIIVLGVEAPDDVRCLNSVDFRHHMIHENQVVHCLRYFADCLIAAESGVNLHVKRLKESLGNSQVDGIVIHNEDFCRLGGKVIVFVRRFNVILAECFVVINSRQRQDG